jgi:hypothetical protein
MKGKPIGAVNIGEHRSKPPAPSPARDESCGGFSPVETTIDLDRHFRSLGIDEFRLFRAELMSILVQLALLGDKVEQAFGAQPFRRDMCADAPENQKRFGTYLKALSSRIKLIQQVHKILLDLVDLEAEQPKQASRAENSRPRRGGK